MYPILVGSEANQRPEERSKRSRMWWNFAIKSVVRENREQRGSLVAFVIPRDELRKYEHAFLKLYPKYTEDPSSLDSDQKLKLIHILEAVEYSDLQK